MIFVVVIIKERRKINCKNKEWFENGSNMVGKWLGHRWENKRQIIQTEIL